MEDLQLTPEILLSMAVFLLVTAIAVFRVYNKYVNNLLK